MLSSVNWFGRVGRGRTRLMSRKRLHCSSSVYTFLEVIFVCALMATASGVAVPQMLTTLDDYRTAGAARYFSTRLQQTRMEAVTRSTEVAVQFSEGPEGVTYRIYVDG